MKLFNDKSTKKAAQAYHLREDGTDAPVIFSQDFVARMDRLIHKKQRAKRAASIIRSGLAVAALAAVIPVGIWLWSLTAENQPVTNPGLGAMETVEPVETVAPTETDEIQLPMITITPTPEPTPMPKTGYALNAPEDAILSSFTNSEEMFYEKKYGSWGDAASEASIPLMQPGFISGDVPLSRIEVIWQDDSTGAFAHYGDDTEDYLYYAQQTTYTPPDITTHDWSVTEQVMVGDVQGFLQLNFGKYYYLHWQVNGILYELGGSSYTPEDLMAMALSMTEAVPGGGDDAPKPSFTCPDNALRGVSAETGETYLYMDYPNWGEAGMAVPYSLARPTVLGGSDDTREAMEFIRVMWYDSGRCEVYVDYDMGLDHNGNGRVFRISQVFGGDNAAVFAALEGVKTRALSFDLCEAVGFVTEDGVNTLMWERLGVLYTLTSPSSALYVDKLADIGDSMG